MAPHTSTPIAAQSCARFAPSPVRTLSPPLRTSNESATAPSEASCTTLHMPTPRQPTFPDSLPDPALIRSLPEAEAHVALVQAELAKFPSSFPSSVAMETQMSALRAADYDDDHTFVKAAS
ncbi:hypothetical protein L202_01225 [Cryptococcus amylolentus CBS 6039]|uniref:Uncharacterized protein n=2 Tax=Cryptococcus amylolentus TaxID=104669 RepID=A0A1E3I2W0_9TREE|nr:hypothetical protein L202_01225 [Cryptococcus amylolentus CBS 6039]ODN82993.1 hypothetical protein L202_01225 [Cryptococcus amylolentus CBS 6039]ODO10617.1 hypothetical protein I350_01214 [Cryptococcus amylolentus CBS 6273]